MKFGAIKAVVDGIPFMTGQKAERITSHILAQNPTKCLELGFAHGVSTCYIAGAMQEAGNGKVVTIDRVSSRERKPTVETLLSACGLRDYVEIYYEHTTYNWRLMRFLEEGLSNEFDLCFIDGAHTWVEDGLAFFLVDKLLKDGGWIIFDDLNWTFATSPSLRESDRVRSMPDDEKMTPQVRKVYELLVAKHPLYRNCYTDSGWGFAQKNIGAAGK